MSEAKRYPAPKMVDRTCKRCKKPFQARAADVKRGWGLFCSKSCKAIKQEARTGQYAAFIERGQNSSEDREASYDAAYDEITGGWDEGGWRDDDSGVTTVRGAA
ncbi:hypothetical protein PEP31012_03679 [Pandoraea eparura]|uniref:Uncharacterized protein n=1 Tax=Pandoraea eparura TaxID=2508291 RepID=A0A5E4X480_9BURK|nr:hypothetical protein [Pandoraea eparura]VVE31076.1 hypothetical protein PEP31012_03679 [Pandoraea eparura]